MSLYAGVCPLHNVWYPAVPEVLQERLKGVPPNVQLYCEPWGHMDHDDNNCVCLLSPVPEGRLPEAPGDGGVATCFDIATWLSAICVPSRWSLWPVAVGYVCTMADWTVNGL